MKKLILVIVFLLIPVWAWGSNINPTKMDQYGGQVWDLADNIVASGNSNTMLGSISCDTYIAFIKASGTVSITAAFVVTDGDGNNPVTVHTYTLSYATTTGYTWSFPTPKMYIVFTITTGQIDDVKVYCGRI